MLQKKVGKPQARRSTITESVRWHTPIVRFIAVIVIIWLGIVARRVVMLGIIKIIRSLMRRGLGVTLRLAFDTLVDYWFDLKYGTNTASWVQLADLAIESENKQRGVHYQPTKVIAFRKVMAALDFPHNSVFVDLGAGKGRTLLLASDYGFKRVIGVEFSPELCRIARRNIAVYRKKVKTNTVIKIIESDVTNYSIKDDENVFFLFNPFDNYVMEKVLRNINYSFQQANRRIWLIYGYPVYHDMIEKIGHFAKVKDYMCMGTKFTIYVR